MIAKIPYKRTVRGFARVQGKDIEQITKKVNEDFESLDWFDNKEDLEISELEKWDIEGVNNKIRFLADNQIKAEQNLNKELAELEGYGLDCVCEDICVFLKINDNGDAPFIYKICLNCGGNIEWH